MPVGSMAVGWTEGFISGVDFETTGIDVRTARIVQWCMADTAPGNEPVIYSEYVNPGIPIPPGATDKHGITDDYVRTFGNPAAESIARLAEEVARRVIGRLPLGGMNLAYDFTVLRYECLRHGVTWPEERAGQALAPVLDAYVLDKRADPFRKGSRQLSDSPVKGPGMATRYGVKLDAADAHNAIPDTIASVEVIRQIGRQYRGEIGQFSVYRLHALQAEWRADQCASLERYFRYGKKPPQPDMVIDPCWPYCADDTHERN